MNSQNVFAQPALPASVLQMTEFCPHFLVHRIDAAHCPNTRPFGRCKFAHAEEEVKPKQFLAVYKRDKCGHFLNGRTCVKPRSCNYLHDEIDGVYDKKRVLADLATGTMRLRLNPPIEDDEDDDDGDEKQQGKKKYPDQAHEWKQMLIRFPIFVDRPETFKQRKCEHVERAMEAKQPWENACPYGLACLNHHPDELGIRSKKKGIVRYMYILTRLLPRQRLCWKQNQHGTWMLTLIPDDFLASPSVPASLLAKLTEPPAPHPLSSPMAPHPLTEPSAPNPFFSSSSAMMLTGNAEPQATRATNMDTSNDGVQKLQKPATFYPPPASYPLQQPSPMLLGQGQGGGGGANGMLQPPRHWPRPSKPARKATGDDMSVGLFFKVFSPQDSKIFHNSNLMLINNPQLRGKPLTPDMPIFTTATTRRILLQTDQADNFFKKN